MILPTIEQLNLTIESYWQAVHWMYSLMTDIEGRRYTEVKTAAERLKIFETRMERMADFLRFAGSPQAGYRSVHVAGTSGKGSVTSMISTLLQAVGFRSGMHTSPYLQICNEKLQINGQMIRPSEFALLVREFEQLYQRYQTSGGKFTELRYGDAWMALVHLWFQKSRVEWAVIETGMGGRYDPSNVLDPDAAVITNVNDDHAEVLGPTLRDIAWHKAGIIKAHTPVITAETKPEILALLEAEAAEKQAPLKRIGKDFYYECHDINQNGATFSVYGPFHTYERLNLAVHGEFQLENACLAVSTVDWLAERACFGVPEQDIRKALASYHYSGRMEVMQHEPVVILDGAHNPHKIQAMIQSIKRIYPNKRITVIFGALNMKDVRNSLELLLPHIHHLIISEPQVLGKPSMPVIAIAKIVDNLFPLLPQEMIPDLAQAIQTALAHLDSTEELLLVTGSLYLIGEARGYWVETDTLLRTLETHPYVR